MTTWQVTASADDCLRIPTTDDYFATNHLEITAGYYSSQYADGGAGMRFLNITIPADVTITSAILRLRASASESNGTVNTRIRAEANISPSTFSDKANFDARTWTTAYVNWDAITGWTSGTDYDSADISACIQEVINLANWASGNAIAILWDDFQKRSTQSNLTRRSSNSYDASTTNAPKLIITYNLNITPATLALTLTTYAPVVNVSNNVTVTPSTLALTLTSYAPSILTPVVVTPATLALILTAYAPTYIVGTVITAGILTLLLTTYRPSLSIMRANWRSPPRQRDDRWVSSLSKGYDYILWLRKMKRHAK